MYVLQALLGCALLALGVLLLWDFPVWRLPLMVLASVLAAAQWRDPRAWLLAVPMLFGVIDLGVWSGRLLAGEQDALLAVLAGTALVAGHYGGAGGQLVRRSFAPLWVLAAVLVIALVRGLTPLTLPDANAWSGYLTGWNALREVKGPLWALVFWPLLAVQLRADRAATEARLALGFAWSLVGFGLYVLWERGLVDDLLNARNLSGLFATWLDLANVYRITGPFSQMHLGGEAIDGYLMLAWPFALWVILRAQARWQVVLGVLALMLAAYAVVLTFTRTTYLAAGVSAIIFAALWFRGEARLPLGRMAGLMAYVILCTVLLLWGFPHGGVLLILGYLAVIGGTLAAGWFASGAPGSVAAGLGLAGVSVGTLLALRGILTSKWGALGLGPALALVVPSVLVMGVAGYPLGRALRAVLRPRDAAAVVLGLAVLLPALTLGLKGAHMSERMTSARSDWAVRVGHWERALSLLADDWPTRLLGAGLGTFPSTHRMLQPDYSGGVWLFDHSGPDAYLRLLGSGSLFVGQRLLGIPPGRYHLRLRMRSAGAEPARLLVSLQPRHLLELQNFQPQTQDWRFAAESGRDWQEVSREIDLDTAAAPPWSDARYTVFALSSAAGRQAAIDVTDLSLRDQAGDEWLANGDFVQGGDHWFAYNDFEHLDWHLKNFYVALYFELGALGLLAFALLALTALVRARGEARRGRLFSAAVAAALVGFLVLGMTGTLLDVPALMTLSLLLMTAALWRERLRRERPRRPTGTRRATAASGHTGPAWESRD